MVTKLKNSKKMSLSNRVLQVQGSFSELVNSYEKDSFQLDELGDSITKIREEQSLLESSRDVLSEVKKIITKSSLEYCERLATVAVRTIFDMPAEVKFSNEDGKFYLVFDNGMMSDIAGDEGGGVKTVISFVFSLYLVMKSGSRRILFFDEAWTQVSSEYFPAFISFIREICKELQFDIFLVTHDERITLEDVDTAYFMENGSCKKIK